MWHHGDPGKISRSRHEVYATRSTWIGQSYAAKYPLGSRVNKGNRFLARARSWTGMCVSEVKHKKKRSSPAPRKTRVSLPRDWPPSAASFYWSRLYSTFLSADRSQKTCQSETGKAERDHCVVLRLKPYQGLGVSSASSASQPLSRWHPSYLVFRSQSASCDAVERQIRPDNGCRAHLNAQAEGNDRLGLKFVNAKQGRRTARRASQLHRGMDSRSTRTRGPASRIVPMEPIPLGVSIAIPSSTQGWPALAASSFSDMSLWTGSRRKKRAPPACCAFSDLRKLPKLHSKHHHFPLAASLFTRSCLALDRDGSI